MCREINYQRIFLKFLHTHKNLITSKLAPRSTFFLHALMRCTASERLNLSKIKISSNFPQSVIVKLAEKVINSNVLCVLDENLLSLNSSLPSQTIQSSAESK